ncbi:MAG: efflux RND transporter periplasmic adaptor subunit [Proteobacteria bacterium]|nr:efflux RND transporter periplasmic adaptor subunit [Pseudomonadota bacterium]
MLSARKVVKVVLPLVIIAVGIGVMVGLVSSRAAPKKHMKREAGALVHVMKVKRTDHALLLKGTGTVQPARSVTIVPQVSGRLRYVSDSMVPGGYFTEGKVMMKIEDVDYRLNVERAMAALATAEFELLKVEGEAKVARTVWESSSHGAEEGAEPNPLVLYTPQLKRARAGLMSAKAALKQERINLERTVLGAPFNSIVRAESAELGQYVRAGTKVATLAGTDSVEVVVPLKVDDIGWIEIPGAGSERVGARATVSMNTGGRVHKWRGTVVRSLGEVDPEGRMERVVIRVEDPYGLSAGSVAKSGDGKVKPALALGSFVNVEIEGGSMRNVIVISRSALRDDNTVWTVEGGNSLKIVNVVPLRVEAETVVLKSGLAGGATVVTTDLSGAADGMALRTVGAKVKKTSNKKSSKVSPE